MNIVCSDFYMTKPEPIKDTPADFSVRRSGEIILSVSTYWNFNEWRRNFFKIYIAW